MGIKEDADRSSDQIEQAKQDQLKEQKQGQGRWREDLASSGESNIAADRQQVDNHDAHMKEGKCRSVGWEKPWTYVIHTCIHDDWAFASNWWLVSSSRQETYNPVSREYDKVFEYKEDRK
ncbi:hypothetical protein COCC4DRAFT_32010 [Bipolaris maydis ATCC 48331]|uniref:Uncharacterized protein n=2 Tax=Cochliobolus heterostrophus TaxID=5016 RepID=M2ULB3_COCH5|nr:uncharacterized protein COCC4DRAFT_32010 [Bipolaris maydis ATCC 48331]EMD88763.1 hypothetical protein COCHEDRAFT_1023017 [Bipolaris maydis C5]KAJ5028660.1 hypothetical protein J3E73DRAFT_291257 [Bipolaris maydis]ENI05522.1 hypothetical protein COCC4DRAFT_32010 [Bipolaris maydis ATCC 48331]KAJ6272832.1 hypothetical protein PSV08DRAFT_282511 [Bipolaris maydis]KAJ6279256.1 hypothetical protein J3E71DRAFT_312553 [Bipolaris maydis]